MARDVVWYIEPLNDLTAQKLRDALPIAEEHEHHNWKTSVGVRPLLFSVGPKKVYNIVNNRLRRDPDTEYALYRQTDGGKIIWQSEKTTRLSA